MTQLQLKRLSIYSAIAFAASAGTLLAVRARAAGIPATAALTYTGYLENPDGTPVTGKKSIGLSFYDAATDGNEVCVQKPADIEPVAGRFQIALPDKCAAAVQANPDLWVEVEVEGALLGRTKLGAVPYALEAAHATTADPHFQGFSAQSSNVTKAAGMQPVVVSVLDFNTFGAAAYSKTGIFTAPIPGYYRFSLSGGSATFATANDSGIAFLFYKNGTIDLPTAGGGQLSAVDTPFGGASEILRLKAGDTVTPGIYSTVDLSFPDVPGSGSGHRVRFQGEFLGN